MVSAPEKASSYNLMAPHRPWQNPFDERLIGSIRRGCLNHVLVLGEGHLRRILARYFLHYHRARTQLALDKDATDQKLHVHASCCVLAFLLLKLLERQARRTGLPVRSPRALLRALDGIREIMVIEPGPRGRPRVRRYLEDLDEPAQRLAACFGLTGPPPVVTTAPRH
jgi:hypothetical protein